MRPTNDRDESGRGAAAEELLLRTRKAVLDILVGVGFLIAVSGWLIRMRAQGGAPRPPRGLHDGLMLALVGVAVASYLVRRSWVRRPSYPGDELSSARFYRLHVRAALVAGIGVPLGLAYGWFVDPRLEGVAPFWVLPIAFGLLAVPRRGELAEWTR
jgi:hypothetical protein